MTRVLAVSASQYSTRGCKPVNQDFHGLCIPEDASRRRTKGIAAALADGISSSGVSQEASQVAVTGFLADYYSTPASWSVKKAGQRVLQALNAWLWSQSQQARCQRDQGYVCTFSAVILKGRKAHLFHVGDACIYRLGDDGLEPLTEAHRCQRYLSRALGMDKAVEIDYLELALEVGDIFVLATDGVYEHLPPSFIAETILSSAGDLQAAAHAMTAEALKRGSGDNLTVQILKIDDLPAAGAQMPESVRLPLPPVPKAGMEFDGYRILRPLHIGHRSHVHLAVDPMTHQKVVIKTPSVEQYGNPAHLERLLLEEWVARRIDNPHVVKAYGPERERSYLYSAFEYVEGRTLAQWLRDHPRPALEQVREIVTQIGKGLQAMHRLEMVHQDLRPENILIDRSGTVKLIDLGSVQVAGLTELDPGELPPDLLGTEQYSAPELFLGQWASPQSDVYSLGVIAYQMLTGGLPYGTRVPKSRTRKDLRRLRYLSAWRPERPMPLWVDEAIRKAVHPQPWKRYREVSEFVHDLHFPNPEFLQKPCPWIERDPVRFWKTVSLILAVALLVTAVLSLSE